jgi:hypothetical protein
MVEVLVCNDNLATEQFFNKASVEMNENSLCIRAMDKDDCLGFCLLEIDGSAAKILYIFPEDDRLLADGLLRTALHVGNERGITEAFYGEKVSEDLLERINFLEEKSEKRLKLQNLFTDCCCCSSKEK